jgi:hypothetical protein
MDYRRSHTRKYIYTEQSHESEDSVPTTGDKHIVITLSYIVR